MGLQAVQTQKAGMTGGDTYEVLLEVYLLLHGRWHLAGLLAGQYPHHSYELVSLSAQCAAQIGGQGLSSRSRTKGVYEVA